ncbi:putative ribonuclease H-like domain-containing protein [Tanacetum coccineum]|uniref:Ribonuclease H-like domain-containing protein n=1 Tax=Tanacetum coccineum TaxID=301880 RepID=A0ABQ5BV72_9ASTR
MVEKPVLNNKGRVTGQREIRLVWNNAQRVNHQYKLTHPHPKRSFVPTAVATKSGQVPVNATKQSSPRATSSTSTTRPVNTAAPKPKVNDALPTTYSYFKAHSLHAVFGDQQEMLLTILAKTVDHACLKDLTMLIYKADSRILDSGCSRHMTGNKSFLTDYQEINAGFVAFGGSTKRGKITRKGKIRTDKLDFEDTECLVLSPDFKLLDESQVLLKVPRHDNMYSFDLKNVVPSGGLTCLFAKAIIDESNLWHRRLGHINFKTMNKLVRGNLDEAVSTACYVQNRVLVTKPHNKTPYELLHGRPPSISFMRPFGCLKVEENLHITFLENKPNVIGSRPDWLFDIDLLTNSMNYEPVTVENQTNKNAEGDQNVQDFRAELDNFLVQQKQGYANNTNRVFIVSPSVSAAGESFTNADDLSTDPLMPDLEDTADLLNTSIFSGAYDDDDEGAEDDLNNLETTMNVSPIPTTRIYKDHPKDQIIGDIKSTTQTRRMTKIFEDHAMVSYIKKQRRTNHKDYQNCLFACFLSQIKPKKVTQALTDPSWIEAIQDELLQFSLQKVWRLVDLPKGKHAIGTKWVYRNKKDERGILVRNKARLFAQEDVYVCEPPGFEDPQFPDKVYKVEKALYGLYQAPKAWYETLSTYLLENRFRRGIIDKTLFIKKDKGVATNVRWLETSGSGTSCSISDRYKTKYSAEEILSETAKGLPLIAPSLRGRADSGNHKLDPIHGNTLMSLLHRELVQSNDPPLSRVNTLGSGEDSMKLKELMELFVSSVLVMNRGMLVYNYCEERVNMFRTLLSTGDRITDVDWDDVQAQIQADEDLALRIDMRKLELNLKPSLSKERPYSVMGKEGTKRARLNLQEESSKRQKTREGSQPIVEEPKADELSQEGLQQIVMIVPVEEVYVEALLVKYLIIN